MRLAHPDILWLLVLLPVLAMLLIWSERRRRRRIREFTKGGRGSFLTLHLQPWDEIRKGVLTLLAVALLIGAAARPQVPAGKVPVVREGRDVAVLLDVSASMLAEDLSPNRLQQARRILNGCLDGMRGDRVALVAFAGEAYVQCPLTLDRSALRIFLSALGPDVVGQRGTGVAGALRKGLQVVGLREDRTRVLLLLTDGEDHIGELEGIRDELRRAGVKVVAIGLGSPTGEPIPVESSGGKTSYKRDAEGKVVMSRLNEELLRDLADATDGYYVRATGSGAEVQAVLAYLDSLEEGEIQGGLRILYEDRYVDFVAPALLLLVVRGLLGQRRRPKKRRGMKASQAAACILLLLGTGHAWAEPEEQDPLVLYEEGHLEEARARLEELRQSDPEDPKLAFGLGNISYRAQEYDDAVGSFGEASQLAEKNEKLEAQALYNQGCARFRAGQIEEALDAFKSSLLVNPKDEDAKANLEFLLSQLQEQQQQQSGDSKDQQDQDQNQDQQQQDQQQQDQQQQDQQQQDQQQQQQNQNRQDSKDEDQQQQQNQQDQEKDQQQQDEQQPSDAEQGPQDEQEPQPAPMPQEAGMSPEDVQRLIEALDLQEKTLQAQRLKSRLKTVETDKDW